MIRALRAAAAAAVLLAAAAAVLLAAAPAAADGFAKWSQDQNAVNIFKLYNLPAPDRGSAAVRLQDVAVGACIPKWSGVNGTASCATVNVDYLLPIVTSPGNYDRVSVAASGLVTGGAAMIVANVAALEALTGANYRDGSEVFVQSVAAYFGLHLASTLTVDHISVASVSGLGGARWLRTAPRDSFWWSQATWDIDPANSTGLCSDENTGADATHPLCSFGEFGRRWTMAVLTQASYTVNLMSDAPAGDPMYLFGVGTIQRSTVVNVIGATTVVATRTMSAVHIPASNTANDHYELIDSGAPFSSWIDTNLLHRTTSTSAFFWPYKDLGSGKLQISIPVDSTAANIVAMSGGDSYEVLALPTFADAWLHNCTRRVSVAIQKVKVIPATIGGPVPSSVGPLLVYTHVLFTGAGASFTASSTGNQISLSNIDLASTVGGVAMSGHVILNAGLYAGNGTTSNIQTTSEMTLLGDAIPATFGGRNLTFTHQTSVDKFAAMVYDWAGGTPFFTVSLASRVYFIGVGGERNSGKLVWSDRGSLAMNVNTITAAITSDTTPFNSDGTLFATVPSTVNTSLNSIYPFPSTVFETGANALLTYGAVPDTTFVKRSGSALVGASVSYQTIANAGSALPAEPTLNFSGGLVAVDNPGSTRTDVTTSLTAGQVGFGSPSNTLTGSTQFLYTDSFTTANVTPAITLGDGSTTTGANIVFNQASGVVSQNLRWRQAGTTYSTFGATRDGTATTGRVTSGVSVTPVAGGSGNDYFEIRQTASGSAQFRVWVKNGDVAAAGLGSSGGDEIGGAATNGFLFIPRSSAAMTGVPALVGGDDGVSSGLRQRAAMAFDRLNNRLYIYDATEPAWHYVKFDDGNGGSAITALTNDVTATGPGSAAATIAGHAVTYSKMQQASTHTLLGNPTGSTADVSEVTLGSGLSFSGTTLVATGAGTVTNVTATLPLTSSGGAAPNIVLQFDNASLTLSGGNALQRAALTNDVTAAAGSNVTTLANIPNDVTMAGDLLATAIAAPATPAAGKGRIWFDSSFKNIMAKGDAGAVNHGAQTFTAAAHQFATALADTGTWTTAQPVEADVVNLVTDLAGKVPTTRTISTTAPLAGGGDLSADRTLSINANGVTDSLLRQGAATSVIGRSGSSAGNVADIAATTNGDVLRMASGTLGWGAIPEASVTNLVTDLAGKQPTITWPVAGRFLVSPGGTGGNPTAGLQVNYDFVKDYLAVEDDASFVIHNSGSGTGSANMEIGHMFWSGNVLQIAVEKTGTGTLRAMNLKTEKGVNVDTNLEVNGAAAPSNVSFIVAHTTNSDRDHVQFFLGGGGQVDTSANTFFDVFVHDTAITTANNSGVLASMRIRNLTYTGTGSPTPTEATSLYIDAAPVLSGATPVFGPYALHVASGAVAFGDLAGTGDRVVAADTNGKLKTVTGGPMTMVWFINGATVTSAIFSFMSTYCRIGSQCLAQQFPIRNAYSHAAVQLNVFTNTGTGTGTWKILLYKNGSPTAATSGGVSIGTTGLVDSGVQSVSISPGDTIGLVIDATALTGTITIETTATLDLSL